MSEARGWRVLGPWPFAALGLLALGFALMLVFSRKAPVIASLDPPMAAPGQTVVVTGEYFGRTEREGSLSLAGEIPPPSLIQSWNDQRIVFVVPEDATSGLVTVANTQGVSRGVLFTNTQSIPTVLQGAGAPDLPLLWSLAPARVQTGQLVTLAGRRFGPGDEASAVVISWGAGALAHSWSVGPRDALSWGDHEITFRVPAGVGQGASLRVKTPRGESAALALDAVGPVALVDPHTVVVDFRWEVGGLAQNVGTLTVWGPVPQDATGTLWTLVSSEPAAVAGPRPLAFVVPGRAETRGTYRLQLTTWARRWDGFPAGLVTGGGAPAGESGPSSFWKGSQGLRTLTTKWGLDTPDPWVRVQRIQTGLGAWTPVFVPLGLRTPEQILASKQADTRELSTLAVALAAQSGIPGRVVSGLWLTPEDEVITRYWAEVWMAGAGWVPWDVADGSPGTLDNRHFGFEVNESVVRRLVARSRTLGPVAPGTLQTPSAEVPQGVDDAVVSWEISLVKK